MHVPERSAADPTPRADVRMHGFSSRTRFVDALAWLDAHLHALPPETIDLVDAAGRTLAADVASRFDVPGFDRAMMDGFAVRAADTSGAAQYTPVHLRIVGDVMPGRPFDGPLAPGHTVRIMTGAPMPADANAVVPVEDAEFDDEWAAILAESTPTKHVGQRGEDVAAGAVLLRAGRALRPQDVGLLAAIGHAQVAVVARPRVRVVVTGNELLPLGATPSGAQILDSNGPMLAALVARDGGIASSKGIVADDESAVEAALCTADAPRPDIVLVSGGSSVGAEDYAHAIVSRRGRLAIHGVAMRPSSPTGLGLLDDRLVFLLPGNPVSCLCAYDLFAGRAIRALAGRPRELPYRTILAPLARKISSVVGRLDYARVRLVDGQIEPLAIGGAAVLSSTVRADGFVLVPDDSEGWPAGAVVQVHLYG